MTKKTYDPEKVARALIRGQPPERISMVAFLEVAGILMNWLRAANSRAKTAEEKLQGQPIWEKEFQVQKRDVERLARERNAAEAKAEALRTQHREELLQQKEKFQADLDALEEQSARCAEMNDQMADALAMQEVESRERIMHLEQLLSASGERSNALALQLSAERRVAKANLVLAMLGVEFIEQNDED